jgi:hypothetical protein
LYPKITVLRSVSGPSGPTGAVAGDIWISY